MIVPMKHGGILLLLWLTFSFPNQNSLVIKNIVEHHYSYYFFLGKGFKDKLVIIKLNNYKAYKKINNKCRVIDEHAVILSELKELCSLLNFILIK